MKKLILFIIPCLMLLLTVPPSFGDRYEFPTQLRTVASTINVFGKHTDTLIGRYYFSPYSEEVTVVWKYRPSTNYEFKNLMQHLSVSYRVLDVWAPTKEWMYLVGVNDNGYTIVEKWRFTHLPILWCYPIGGGVPQWIKPTPMVRRVQLYNGTELTHIASILGDPQRRYLLLFGWENKYIYKMNVANGSYQFLFGPAQNADIALHRRLSSMHHITEGYIFYLVPYPKGITSFGLNVHLTRPDGPNGADITYQCTDTVIFRDANKDGNIEMSSLQSMTKEQWYDAGYCFESNFSPDP